MGNDDLLNSTHSGSRINCALQCQAEIEGAENQLVRSGVFLHPNRPKNWDGWKALSFILHFVSTNEPILDVGCQ